MLFVNKSSSDKFFLCFNFSFSSSFDSSFSFQLLLDNTRIVGIRISHFSLKKQNNQNWKSSIVCFKFQIFNSILIALLITITNNKNKQVTASISSSSSSIVDTVTEENFPMFLVCLVTIIFWGSPEAPSALNVLYILRNCPSPERTRDPLRINVTLLWRSCL